MRDPHVRFRERHGGVIPRAYSTRRRRTRVLPAYRNRSAGPVPVHCLAARTVTSPMIGKSMSRGAQLRVRLT
jgi:hypothetical protein